MDTSASYIHTGRNPTEAVIARPLDLEPDQPPEAHYNPGFTSQRDGSISQSLESSYDSTLESTELEEQPDEGNSISGTLSCPGGAQGDEVAELPGTEGESADLLLPGALGDEVTEPQGTEGEIADLILPDHMVLPDTMNPYTELTVRRSTRVRKPNSR